MMRTTFVLLAGSLFALAGAWHPVALSNGSTYTPQDGEFRLSKDAKYQMPVTMGETLKLPEQIRDVGVKVLEATFQTEVASLLPFIPEQLELLAPNVTIAFKRYEGVAWLSGRSYEQIALTVPVRYTAQDGTVTDGNFAPVVWSSSAEAIQAFRESMNIPFVYANISYDSRSMSAKWDHTTFLNVDHSGDSAEGGRVVAASRANLLSWGYIPSAVGKTPTASISQLMRVPVDGTFSQTPVSCSVALKKPAVTSGEPDPGFDAMPTEWRIVNALAALPMHGDVQCVSKHGSENLRYDLVSILHDNTMSRRKAADRKAHIGEYGQFREHSSTIYAMPITFGGYYSPHVGPASYPDTASLYVQYETDPAALLPYIPSGLKLLSPQITISFARNYNVGWLAGRSYDMIDLGIPVGYTYPNGTVMEASINLVVWENCWEGCLLTGREMSGVPKIWADTVFTNGTTEHGVSTKAMRAAWGNIDFLHLSATVPPPTPVPPQNMTLNHAFQWKYFPDPRDGTKAQISQLTDYPTGYMTTSYAAGTDCVVKWLPGRSENLTFAEMPTQYRVINALANMPIRGTPTCGLSHSAGILRNDLSSIIVDSFMLPSHKTVYV